MERDRSGVRPRLLQVHLPLPSRTHDMVDVLDSVLLVQVHPAGSGDRAEVEGAAMGVGAGEDHLHIICG